MHCGACTIPAGLGICGTHVCHATGLEGATHINQRDLYMNVASIHAARPAALPLAAPAAPALVTPTCGDNGNCPQTPKK